MCVVYLYHGLFSGGFRGMEQLLVGNNLPLCEVDLKQSHHGVKMCRTLGVYV